MDDASKLPWPQLLDQLEQVLVSRFGLRSARARARELLGSETLALARERVEAARSAHAALETDAGGTLLEQLARARAVEAEAEAVVARLERWHGRERAEARLAVELFVDAPELGPARESGWPESNAPASAGPAPLYLRNPELRICGHFEPDLDLLIHDRALGTLALVQVLDTCEGEAIQAQVRRLVDRATYLRHLLLTARDEHQGGDRQIISVELVLVHRAHDQDGDGQVDLLFEVGEILRQLAQRTDFLHAIGVNVLAAGPQGFAPAQLRRAFSWLLHDTRRWFAELEQRHMEAHAGGEDELGPLRAIELDEYRLPGHRSLVLHEDARLHLLHGHNGSGKSSFVEALELMITGNIERLAGIEDYEHVVRNRWSRTPARVSLHTDKRAEPLRFELHGTERPPAPLAPGSRAASFRLDQTVMDRLARASDVDRAAELLAAFFADEAEVRERWHQAMHEAEAALARLPERVRNWLEAHRRERQDLHEVAVEQLSCLAEHRVSARLVDAVLPMTRSSLRPLVGQIEALAQLERVLESEGYVAADASLWDTLESAFEALAGALPERVATVESVLRTLDRLELWWREGEGEGFDSEADFAAALDEWLELGALVEIAGSQGQILSALRRAREQGWELGHLDEAGSAGALLRELAGSKAELVRDLERARERWIQRHRALGRALRQSREIKTDAKPLAAARVRLDDEELEELDRFGSWWSPDERGPGLGARIRGAIERGEGPSFAKVAIGTQAWVEPIAAVAEAMLRPLRELRDDWSPTLPAQQAVVAPVTTERASAADDDDLDLGELAAEAPESAASEAETVEMVEVVEEALDEDKPVEAEEDDDVASGDRFFDLTERVDLGRFGEPGGQAGEPGGQAGEPGGQAPRRVRRKQVAAPKPQGERLSLGASKGLVPLSAPPPAAKPVAAAKPGPRALRPPQPPASPEPSLELEPEPASRPEPTEAEEPEVPASEFAQPIPMESLGLSDLIDRLRQVYMLSLRAREVGAEVQDSFVARLATNDARALGLIDALNELMALFTPARWAYEDVVLRYLETDDVSRLRFETGELRGGPDPQARARADLRLNTAQLNAFTLALFLLCAPRVDNPLGLLVLDDPLQNMDELTVTTLARGLAKLLRVLPPRWSIVMLFHGEGDLARFHDELECGVYFLPWLSPTVRGQMIDIRCQEQDSRLRLSVQTLDELVALRPS